MATGGTSSTQLPIAEIMETINFAAIAHSEQKRKDKKATPFINHPIGVARIITKEAGVTGDLIVVQAALLHDVIEDTETTEKDLRKVFGDEVTDIVMEVTDDKNLSYEERKQLQIDHAEHLSHRAKLVKLADKLYNLRDLHLCTPVGWDQERVQAYFVWASKVCRGLRGTNKVLEDELDKLFAKYKIKLSGM